MTNAARFSWQSASPSELNDQYDTSKQLPGGDVAPYFSRFEAESERARHDLVHEAGIPYGPHERETLDAFPAREPRAPLFLWVHGGYWRRMSKRAYSFVARPIVQAGGAAVIVNYPLAPGATLDDIVSAVGRAYVFARDRAPALNADPKRIFVGGHSVGAQLAATIAARHPVCGLLAISGLYELEPLRHTHINDWIAMDAPTAARNSPIRLPPSQSGPLVASVGEREQFEFHRQQDEYVAAWRAWGGSVRTIAAPEHDHFSIALELACGTTPLAIALLEMMALGSGR